MTTPLQEQIARESAKDFCEKHGLREHFIEKDLKRAFFSALERVTEPQLPQEDYDNLVRDAMSWRHQQCKAPTQFPMNKQIVQEFALEVVTYCTTRHQRFVKLEIVEGIIQKSIERATEAKDKEIANHVVGMLERQAAQPQPSKGSPASGERSDHELCEVCGSDLDAPVSSPPRSQQQEWTVQEKPSGLAGIDEFPPTCIQIYCGDVTITHALEPSRYNRHLLQEACDAHNAKRMTAGEFGRHLTEQSAKYERQLADEREAFDRLESQLKSQLAEEVRKREQAEDSEEEAYANYKEAERQRDEARDQLLSALAAIENHNKECPDECDKIVL